MSIVSDSGGTGLNQSLDAQMARHRARSWPTPGALGTVVRIIDRGDGAYGRMWKQAVVQFDSGELRHLNAHAFGRREFTPGERVLLSGGQIEPVEPTAEDYAGMSALGAEAVRALRRAGR